MLKLAQAESRTHDSEQFCSDDDDVSFAASNAHFIGPFGVVFDFLNDTT